MFKKEYVIKGQQVVAERYEVTVVYGPNDEEKTGVGVRVSDKDDPANKSELVLVDDGKLVHVIVDINGGEVGLDARLPREAVIAWLEDSLSALKGTPAQQEAA